MKPTPGSEIKEEDACECSICGAPADLMDTDRYQCQATPSHSSGVFKGIFADSEATS